MLKRLREVRASNLVFVVLAPIIIWLLVTSRNYGSALKAVLGIEDQPLILLSMFILCSLYWILGFLGAYYILSATKLNESTKNVALKRTRALSCFIVQSISGILIINLEGIDTYLVSVIVNELDPRTSDYVIVSDNLFILDETYRLKLIEFAHHAFNWLISLSVLCIAWSILPKTLHSSGSGKAITFVILAFNFCLAFYVIMVAHAGFAVGLMVTLRAAFFAYIAASLLGLIWAMMSRLKPSKLASKIFFMTGAVLLLISIWQFNAPKQQVILIGDLEGRVGIISGTPQNISDAIRYGDFQEEPPEKPYKIRSLATVEQALDLYQKGSITAVLVPEKYKNEGIHIWRTNYLPTVKKTIAISCLSFGVLLLLLAAIGALIQAHPLVVFSDFFVDTIRGVPMLVIILYVGLPLSGALKSASAGYIDLQMMTRGVLAIAIGYSAYMAEIFRAGIEAVPKGQIEAARSLGLREFQITRIIIIPQAIAIVLPALGNEFIAMLKDTSLVSILSVRDLTQRMREFQAQSFLAFEPFNSAALIYVILTLLAASGVKALSNMVGKGKEH
jgi:polar amino acid transport system permease protein